MWLVCFNLIKINYVALMASQKIKRQLCLVFTEACVNRYFFPACNVHFYVVSLRRFKVKNITVAYYVIFAA